MRTPRVMPQTNMSNNVSEKLKGNVAGACVSFRHSAGCHDPESARWSPRCCGYQSGELRYMQEDVIYEAIGSNPKSLEDH